MKHITEKEEVHKSVWEIFTSQMKDLFSWVVLWMNDMFRSAIATVQMARKNVLSFQKTKFGEKIVELNKNLHFELALLNWDLRVKC